MAPLEEQDSVNYIQKYQRICINWDTKWSWGSGLLVKCPTAPRKTDSVNHHCILAKTTYCADNETQLQASQEPLASTCGEPSEYDLTDWHFYNSKQVWSIAITTRLIPPASACLPSYIHTILLREMVGIQGLRDPNTDYLYTEKYLRVHLIGTLGYAYVILHKNESHLSRCG